MSSASSEKLMVANGPRQGPPSARSVLGRRSGTAVRPAATRPQALLVAAAAFGLVSACSSAVDGHPRATVAPGTVEASFLPPDDVSALVGTTLVPGDTASEPPGRLGADPPACAVAVGPATDAVYARGWRRFGSRSYQDPTAEHVVTQVLGAYPDEAQAQAAFGALAKGLAGCPAAVRANQDHSSVRWTYAVTAAAPDSVAWTATQDAGAGWACFRQARRKVRALLQVSVCQAGDGRQAAGTLVERFAAKVAP